MRVTCELPQTTRASAIMLVAAGAALAALPARGGHGALACALLALAGALAVGSAALRALRDPAGRVAWALIALAVASMWTNVMLYGFGRGASSFPSPADAGLVTFYPAVIVVAVMLCRRRLGGLPRALWLDAGIGGLAVGALIAAFVIEPRIRLHEADPAVIGQVVYSVADLVGAVFVIGVAGSTGWRPGRALILLGVGMAVFGFGDIDYLGDVTAGAMHPGLDEMLGWAVGLLLLAAVPIAAAGERRAPVERRQGVSVALTATLAVLPLAVGGRGGAAALLSVATLMLAMVRLAVTLRDNRRLLLDARRAATRTAAITESLGEGVIATGPEGRVAFANPAAQRMLGRRAADLLGRDPHALLHPACGDDCALGAALAAGARAWGDDDKFARPDGALPVAFSVAPIELDGAFGGAVIAFSDVSDRREALRLLGRRADQQAIVAEIGERALRGAELDTLMDEVAEGAARGLGVGCVELRVAEHVIRRGCGGGRHAVRAAIEARGERFGELCAFADDASALPRQDVNFVQSLANVLADAIARSRAEAGVRHQALHDPLTGLPNRLLFSDRLRHALAQRERAGETVAVLFLDLDQFKRVNDTLGHRAGDRLLAAVGERLTATLRPGDTVARFGGDEFAIVAAVAGQDGAVEVARRVTDALAQPFPLGGEDHYAAASIGIALADGGRTAEELMADADAAMYRAKEAGHGWSVFDAGMRDAAARRLRVRNELHRALRQDELVLHYQPLVSLAAGGVGAVEALVRWQHPERGLLGPGEFVPVAEESGLIVTLGDWVLRVACAQLAAWRAGHPELADLVMSVNLSPRQLGSPHLTELVAGLLRRHELPPEQLALEITETALLDPSTATAAALAELKALGVRLVLDDFGTGYSSLSHLKRYPIDSLKVDRSFISEIEDAADSAPIVEAVIGMGHALGLAVVAEGVETEAQVECLRALGCDFVQGYLLGRPAPAAALPQLAAA